MSEAMETLKNLLGDDAEDKIKDVMGMISSGDNTQNANPAELNQIMQIKNIMEGMAVNKNDPRTNLLLSLKPYMRESRRNSIDSAVKLLGITKVARMLRK